MAYLIDTTILARLANATDGQHFVAARAVLELPPVELLAQLAEPFSRVGRPVYGNLTLEPDGTATACKAV